MTLRFGSVCSGIEAASVAFAPLGWEPAWLAEIDVPASAVLAHRLGASAPVYPLDPDEEGISEKERRSRRNTIKRAEKITWRDRISNWGDMKRLPKLIRSGDAEAPEVLCGGTPCQGFSVAGLRGGLDDPRGQLTLSFVELANAIDDVRREREDDPCVVFWENVPGVLSDKGNGFGHFLAGLAGEDLPLEPPRGKWTNAGLVVGPQRAVAWVVKDAQYFGLAQRRARVFVVASAMEGFDPGLILFEFEGLRRDTPPSREAWKDVAGDSAPCPASRGRSGDNEAALPPGTRSDMTPKGYRLVSFGEYRDDELASTMLGRDHKYVTDIVVDQPAYALQAGVTRQNPDTGPDGMGVSEELAYTLESRSEVQITVYASDICPTLRAGGNSTRGDRPPGTDVDTADSNIVCLSDSGPTLAFDTTQVTSPENGCNPQWGDPCHPLVTTGHPPTVVLSQNIAVRRLIPVECERLQGFFDGWTDIPVGNKPVTDGHRYRQLGNSWAVPCVHWIGKRIKNEIRRVRNLRLI